MSVNEEAAVCSDKKTIFLFCDKNVPNLIEHDVSVSGLLKQSLCELKRRHGDPPLEHLDCGSALAQCKAHDK